LRRSYPDSRFLILNIMNTRGSGFQGARDRKQSGSGVRGFWGSGAEKRLEPFDP
jgi:hypothetical protein